MGLARCLSLIPNVIDVDLSKNGLISLPETIYELESMQRINLEGNSFDEEERKKIEEKLKAMNNKILIRI